MSARDFLLDVVVPFAVSVLAAGTAVAQDAGGPRTFTYSCDSLAIDLKSNKSVCSKVEISDGSIEISADSANASETNFESSEWQFIGNVRIALGTAIMSGDMAVFRFAANELAFGELSGSPVELRDFVEEQGTAVRGTAERIAYDNRDGTARMEGNARLARGENEYIGCDIIYNLNEKTLDLGSPDCRVQLRILPPGEEGGGPSEESGAPPGEESGAPPDEESSASGESPQAP